LILTYKLALLNPRFNDELL